jgi:acetyl-CoA C-acetyltransferase/potassium large conductance calcium-activated channel subfamily M alpha protein 1
VVEEIKMNLLAKSCFAPGLIAMISNLIASAGDIEL